MTPEERAATAVEKWVREGGVGARIEHFLAEAIREAVTEAKAQWAGVINEGDWLRWDDDYYRTFDSERSLKNLREALECC